eukprot:1158607-Pelagomonas_calceolata.AAC.3
MLHKVLHQSIGFKPNTSLPCLPCIRPSLFRGCISQWHYEASLPSSCFPSPLHQSLARRPACILASTANEETASTSFDHQPSTSASTSDEEDLNFGLVLPDKHYQGALDMATRNKLKSKANTAAREKTLMYLQVKDMVIKVSCSLRCL